MENTTTITTMTNAELLAAFYDEAVAFGLAVAYHDSLMDTVNRIKELWAEVSKRFIKPQETAR